MLKYVIAFLWVFTAGAQISFAAEPVKAVYFGANAYGSKNRIQNIVYLLQKTEVNAVAVDLKDDRGKVFEGEKFHEVVRPFRETGAFIVCRIVALKDKRYATLHPELALKSRSTGRAWIGKGEMFLDPSKPQVVQYLVSLAQKAVDYGCEPNFDYIRYPSEGNLSDIAHPVSNAYAQKHPYLRKTLRTFLAALSAGIRKKDPNVLFSADLFGYAAMSSEAGIGQYVEDFAEFGFGIYGMFYPSHFKCNAFDIPDPNTNPFRVYRESMAAQLRYLKKRGFT